MAVRRLGGRIVAFAATVALSIPLGLLTNSAWAVEDATRSDSTTQMSSTPEVVYSSAVDSKQNRTSDFDANWKFMLSDSVQAQDPAFDDSAWQQVDLPHDYSITQKYSQSNEAESAYLPGGTGWYRKSFTIDRDLAGKRIAINFDGVYMNATVWFNGVKLGTHPYGYSPFSFDLTGNAKFGGGRTPSSSRSRTGCRPAAGTPAPASTATSPSPSPTACTSAITAWPSRPRASPPKTAAT